jgi:hypothetical protein
LRRSSALTLIELSARDHATGGSLMRAEEACVGMKVRVREEHRILERRGMVGKVVGCFGPRTLRRRFLLLPVRGGVR